MKTTILHWGRAEGKTTRMVGMIEQLPCYENILVLTMTGKEAKRLMTEYPVLKIGQIKVACFHPSELDNALKGYNPEHIFIDNAEQLTDKAIHKIKGCQPIKTLTVTGSDISIILYKVPHLLGYGKVNE